MRYWFDTEFIENGKTIDLISIGIVCSDGREYYAISLEFNGYRASQWVKDNVISQLPPRPAIIHNPWVSPSEKENAKFWKRRKTIAAEVREFLLFDPYPVIDGQLDESPEIWAYYADYDWVALCQLFGTMMDLPKGFPMYCRDIKQECDRVGNPKLPKQESGEHNALADARWNKQAWDFLFGFNQDLAIVPSTPTF